MAKRNTSQNLNVLLDQVRSNLPNFLLGLTILIVFILLSSLYFQRGNKPTTQAKTPSLFELLSGKKALEAPKKKAPRKYVVKEGDYLWTIAEKFYGSGYNAYDIAKANNLQNPDAVIAGQELVIPEISSKDPTRGEMVGVMTDRVTIQSAEYIVKEGDSLWSIAQGAYGDGNTWIRIAQANKLPNPDVIDAGQKLSLPR